MGIRSQARTQYIDAGCAFHGGRQHGCGRASAAIRIIRPRLPIMRWRRTGFTILLQASHYTICTLSYLLDITIANRLKEVDIGVRSPQKVYEVLKDGIIGKITMKSTGDEFLKLRSPQSQQKSILELFQSENVVRRGGI